jgi:hypothetical protein
MWDENAGHHAVTTEELTLWLRTSSAICKTDAGNKFFNSFGYVEALRNGQYSRCVNEGLRLLSDCKSLDPRSFARIHKGSAYYWIGMASFLANDFQSATFFFDAAVTEDIRAGYDPLVRSTPSFKFLMIEGEADSQAAKQMVIELQRRLQLAMDDYNQRPGRTAAHPTCSLPLLRAHFIAPALSPLDTRLRSLPTALISFVLEWFYLNLFLDIRGGPGTSEPFMVHLFKGCVLFETRHPIPASAKSLLPVLQALRRDLLLPNDLPISAPDFGAVLQALSSSSASIQDAFVTTGRLRNTLGHRLEWSSQLDNPIFNKLVFSILAACIHAILNLYCP